MGRPGASQKGADLMTRCGSYAESFKRRGNPGPRRRAPSSVSPPSRPDERRPGPSALGAERREHAEPHQTTQGDPGVQRRVPSNAKAGLEKAGLHQATKGDQGPQRRAAPSDEGRPEPAVDRPRHKAAKRGKLKTGRPPGDGIARSAASSKPPPNTRCQRATSLPAGDGTCGHFHSLARGPAQHGRGLPPNALSLAWATSHGVET